MTDHSDPHSNKAIAERQKRIISLMEVMTDPHWNQSIAERQKRIISLMESMRILAIAILAGLTILMMGEVWLQREGEERARTNKATQALICDTYQKLDLVPPNNSVCSPPP